MPLKYELREVTFRKEQYTIPYQYYYCEDSDEQFVDTALDEQNMQLLENHYRARHHIPLPAEITAIREQYGLSATRMGEILGFGPNTYGSYEKGDLPNPSNAKLLKVASDPARFLDLIEDWENADTKAGEKLKARVRELKVARKNTYISLQNHLMGTETASKFTGFKRPDLSKLMAMTRYFASLIPSYKTKMNKLLFYADFGMFKAHGRSISGAQYRAIAYGPVPSRYEAVYENMEQGDMLQIDRSLNDDGGQVSLLRAKEEDFSGIFTDQELQVLSKVAEKFKDMSPRDIVTLSHEEDCWKQNKEERSIISYHGAFSLRGLD